MNASENSFVVLFPSLHINDENFINLMRKKYDPLFNQIPCHITLVFPQTLVNVKRLKRITSEVFANTAPCHVTLDNLNCYHGQFGSYLFLSPSKKASKIFISWHNKLYAYDNLTSTLHKNESYSPHLTLGKFANANEAEEALQKASRQFQPCEVNINEVAVGILANEKVSMLSKLNFNDQGT
jgi:2'-5' RNA ligase